MSSANEVNSLKHLIPKRGGNLLKTPKNIGLKVVEPTFQHTELEHTP